LRCRTRGIVCIPCRTAVDFGSLVIRTTGQVARVFGAVLAIVVAVPWTTAEAKATTPMEAIAFLDEQRAAAGIPASLALNAILSQGCSLHLAYLAANASNPDSSPHEENPAKPGYTALGAEAAEQSDLVTGGAPPDLWSASENPWMGSFDYGPLHFAALFDPASAEAWYSDDGQRYCMGTDGARRFESNPPRSPELYSYPGNGQAGVPPKVEDIEWPTDPNTQAGLSGVTGPNLLFYFRSGAEVMPGLWSPNRYPAIASATVVGPTGAVDVRTAVDADADFVIPVSPLAANTKYVATVIWSVSGTSLSQTVSFTTGTVGLPSNLFAAKEYTRGTGTRTDKRLPRKVGLLIKRVVRSGRWLRLTVSASPVLQGHRVSATIRYLRSTTHGGHAGGRSTTAFVLHGTTVRIRGNRNGPLVVYLATPAFVTHGVTYGPAATSRRVHASSVAQSAMGARELFPGPPR
jgi:hypothetical protein